MNLILELNSKIFNSINNAKFIDSKKYEFRGSQCGVLINLFSIMIDYNGDLYNILSFEKIYKILIRKEKPKKLRNL